MTRNLPARPCKTCGAAFKPRTQQSLYCSKTCVRHPHAPRHKGGEALDEGPVWYPTRAGYTIGTVVERGKPRKTSQHRYMMEQALGRRLRRDEWVVRRDPYGSQTDLENLEIISPGEFWRRYRAKMQGQE